ncbi:hypothetical protein CPB86DRAFT_633253 [Serendipita vermifera]|nr:hypothetical protein CPB86DRAFT_633253 [Serendipita vermifera]
MTLSFKTAISLVLLSVMGSTLLTPVNAASTPVLARRTDDNPIYAVAVLKGTGNVNGTVYFTQDAQGNPVKITGEIWGLDPNADRGFHVHQYGDLTNGCTSTGAHYNPTNQTHGGPEDAVRHVGDLGNIHSDENGIAHLDFTDSVIALSGDYSILGRGIVVHTGTDDLGRGGNENSTTTGNSGGRAACGVIGLTAPPTN